MFYNALNNFLVYIPVHKAFAEVLKTWHFPYSAFMVDRLMRGIVPSPNYATDFIGMTFINWVFSFFRILSKIIMSTNKRQSFEFVSQKVTFDKCSIWRNFTWLLFYIFHLETGLSWTMLCADLATNRRKVSIVPYVLKMIAEDVFKIMIVLLLTYTSFIMTKLTT